ncbi:MAG: hypothetical protein IH941_11745 [Acidobacteria bacterium]|nr:hypothetical protein [Acidobacteriota bacterium]
MAFAESLALVLTFAACSPAAAPVTTAAIPKADRSGSMILSNQGGTLEGHTPRGFAGMGTGLFAGDNLNPNFPDGDGVQMYLTFEAQSMVDVSSATLFSDPLTVRGAPFEDLGSLLAEPVTYDAFGPALFDLEAIGPVVVCERIGSSGITCDVTDSVRSSLDTGETRLQFWLRFDRAGDGDGRADLAMFFFTDSNTNEPGLFTLTLTG